MAWTDERLEERFDGIDRRFDEVDRRLDEVNRRVTEAGQETNRRFREVDRRFDGIEGQIVELRHGMGTLQATLNRAGTGIVLSLMGVIAAILVKGG